MATDSTKVGVAVTGAVYRLDAAATAPTSVSSAITGDELGWISEEGITRAMPGAGEAEVVRGWQNGAVVRVLRTPSEENPTFAFTMLETNIEVIEATYGVTVTQNATDGSYVIDTSTVRTRDPWVIDVIDGAELSRYYIPQGEVVEIGEQTLANATATGYQVTVEAHRDDAIGGQVKIWETRLKAA